MQRRSSVHRLYNSRTRVWILLFAPILSIVLIWSWLRRPQSLLLQHYLMPSSDHVPPPTAAGDEGSTIPSNDKPTMNNHNPRLPGMDDILVVLKTGVTEALLKVPVHLETTLTSVPNFAIFSDYEEDIAGIKTHDVLDRISEEVKRTIPEFELYNRIREHGRQALTEADHGDDFNGPFGRVNNPGWKLDKWKFLPMIPTALELKPDAKWFVFMEADTYFMWPNLVAWLSQLDPQQEWYLGYPMQIAETVFGYGGSGFVVSNPAMQKVSKYLAEHSQELDEYTASQWAGDCVLGQVFDDAGVTLHWAWPMLQDSKPWELDHFANAYDRRAWCYPVVSYHHMQPEDIRDLWEFDKEWFKLDDPNTRLLLYSDVFRRLILPDILSLRVGWDNGADVPLINEDGSNAEMTLQNCDYYCTKDESCLQYRHIEAEKSCYISSSVKRGVSAKGVKSNWMIDRVFDKLGDYGQTCANAEFVL